jgi:hypothetical protein
MKDSWIRKIYTVSYYRQVECFTCYTDVCKNATSVSVLSNRNVSLEILHMIYYIMVYHSPTALWK